MNIENIIKKILDNFDNIIIKKISVTILMGKDWNIDKTFGDAILLEEPLNDIRVQVRLIYNNSDEIEKIELMFDNDDKILKTYQFNIRDYQILKDFVQRLLLKL